MSGPVGHLKLVSFWEHKLQRESYIFSAVPTHVTSFVPIRWVCPHHWFELRGMLKTTVAWHIAAGECGRGSRRLIWHWWQKFADHCGSYSSLHDPGILECSGRRSRSALTTFLRPVSWIVTSPDKLIFFLTILPVVAVVCNQDPQTVQNFERTEKGFSFWQGLTDASHHIQPSVQLSFWHAPSLQAGNQGSIYICEEKIVSD